MRLSLKESRMKLLNATNLDRKSGIRGPKTMGEPLRQHFVPDLSFCLLSAPAWPSYLLEFLPSPSQLRLAVRPQPYPPSRRRWSDLTESGMASRTSGSGSSAKSNLPSSSGRSSLAIWSMNGLGAEPAHERRITLGQSRCHHPGVV